MTNSSFVASMKFIIFFWTALLAGSCAHRPDWTSHAFAGTTMGTTYSVKVVVPAQDAVDRARVAGRIEARLERVNAKMSSWVPSSDVCRFNRHRDSQQPIEVSPETARVLAQALRVAEWSGGAFDPTVDPLVERWGFGTEDRRAPPDEEEISGLMERVGYEKVKLVGMNVWKSHPELQLNLSAIAKGYGVDAVAEELIDLGFSDFMVEIGGEVRTSGFNVQRHPWRIGIESPNVALDQRSLYCIAEISGYAIATSGDYRNFFEERGARFGHIIDPHTGYPISSDIASVSVIAQDCLLADALATAITVMGAAPGLALARELDGVECLILRRTDAGDLTAEMTAGITAFLHMD